MDQAKIGSFLKKLRNEKHLTQEQLAERFYTSSRTVSRWENGINLPDLGTLIELADFYGVDIGEIIDGERKDEAPDAEQKYTFSQMAEYSDWVKKKQFRKIYTEYAGSLSVAVLFWLVFRTLGWLSDGEIIGVLFLLCFYYLLIGYIKINPDAKKTRIVRIVYLVLSGGFYVFSVFSFLNGIVSLGVFFFIFGTVFFFCCLKADTILKARKHR